jgi:serine/threonine-protein kinase HipA
MNRCMYCYKELSNSENDYHKKCVKKFFKTDTIPLLDYTLDDMYKLGKNIVQQSVTVPGVQTKLSINIQQAHKNSHKLTIVGLWGNYILKPPSTTYANLPENEDLTMHLAELFDIEVVPHSLIKLKSGELSYITRRIDREGKKKIHMEDMCQLTERLTEDKYKGSMERIGKVILKNSTNRGLDAIRFFEIALFSFLTGNADMHLKNFSLIYEEGEVKFTPAYDLLSTRLVISERKDPEEMALTLNGKKRRLNNDDFVRFGKDLKLNKTQIENVFEKFSNQFSKAIDFINISFLPDVLKEPYNEILSERYNQLSLN